MTSPAHESSTVNDPDESWGTFRKSSFSDSVNCVEVAFQKNPSGILVRNSRNPESGTLEFTIGEWTAFLRGVNAGEFHHPGEPAPEE